MSHHELATPGEIIKLHEMLNDPEMNNTRALFKGSQVEVIIMFIPAGKEIPAHKAPGEIVVNCIKGKIEFTHGENITEIAEKEMLYLEAGVTHSLKGLEDSTMLVTIIRNSHL